MFLNYYGFSDENSFLDFNFTVRENLGFHMLLIKSLNLLSCHAFKLGISSDQDGRTTRILQFLTIRFK